MNFLLTLGAISSLAASNPLVKKLDYVTDPTQTTSLQRKRVSIIDPIQTQVIDPIQTQGTFGSVIQNGTNEQEKTVIQNGGQQFQVIDPIQTQGGQQFQVIDPIQTQGGQQFQVIDPIQTQGGTQNECRTTAQCKDEHICLDKKCQACVMSNNNLYLDGQYKCCMERGVCMGKMHGIGGQQFQAVNPKLTPGTLRSVNQNDTIKREIIIVSVVPSRTRGPGDSCDKDSDCMVGRCGIAPFDNFRKCRECDANTTCVSGACDINFGWCFFKSDKAVCGENIPHEACKSGICQNNVCGTSMANMNNPVNQYRNPQHLNNFLNQYRNAQQPHLNNFRMANMNNPANQNQNPQHYNFLNQYRNAQQPHLNNFRMANMNNQGMANMNNQVNQYRNAQQPHLNNFRMANMNNQGMANMNNQAVVYSTPSFGLRPNSATTVLYSGNSGSI